MTRADSSLDCRDTMEINPLDAIPVPDDSEVPPDQRKTIEVRRPDVIRQEQPSLLRPIAHKFPILYEEVHRMVRLFTELAGEEADSHFGVYLGSCRSLLAILSRTDVSAMNVQFMINQRITELQSLLANPELDKKVRETVFSAIMCLREHEPLILSGEIAGNVHRTTGTL